MRLPPAECPNCGHLHPGADFIGDPGPVQKALTELQRESFGRLWPVPLKVGYRVRVFEGEESYEGMVCKIDYATAVWADVPDDGDRVFTVVADDGMTRLATPDRVGTKLVRID